MSTLPWPQLFSLDAIPGNAVFFDPRLMVVLVGHYGILAAGGALGLLAGAMLGFGLRQHPWSAAAALLVAAGSALMGYAAARRAIDVTMHAGRSTVELSTLVWAGGGMILLGTLLLTLALRRRGGKLFLILGLSSPGLIAAGTTIFLVLGPDAIPVIWGVTFPPPPDYLLAVWFIVLGSLARKGRLQGGVGVERPFRGRNRHAPGARQLTDPASLATSAQSSKHRITAADSTGQCNSLVELL